ncbi:MAG: ABC transporter permease subunit [Chloroflexi bacterium]|nr:MAG: ABC transporter permease subunit [Chloroflexota bacterium]
MRESRTGIRVLTYKGVPLWRDIRVIQAVAQIVSALVVLGFLAFFIDNVLKAADARGLNLGFDFLKETAGFPIGESVISYHPSNTFGRAFVVGLLNTLKVAGVGVVLATILGIIIGVARLSSNWLVRNLASAYIETIRNVPLLVQLFFWFFAVFRRLPPVQESIQMGGLIFLNQRGVYMVWFDPTPTFRTWLIVLLAGVVLSVVLWLVLSRWQLQTGRSTYPVLTALVVLILVPAVGWVLMSQPPLTLDLPVLGRFNYEGGIRLTNQFSALLVGLVIYTASFIAEVVRAGIQAVSRGQVEAARAIGLSNLQALRLVIFPQALRVIIPPLISQYLNLTKNSSLAIAIGYPDVFTVGRIMINQAGRAVPVFAMVMVAYLVMSLTYSVVLNLYNRRIQFVER